MTDEQSMPPGPLAFKEKAGFIGLLVFAILVVILGFKNFDNTIKAPFAKQLLAAPVPGEPTTDEINASLKNKDTDGDGLSDYDELNLSHTSPYLADTDSDGIPDGVEIKNSTDPNCPEGKSCGFSPVVNPTATGEKTIQPGLTPPDPSQQQNLVNLLNLVNSPNKDPKALREFLVSQGVDEKLLGKVSDQELWSLFREEEARPHPSPLPAAGEGTLPPSLPLGKGGFDAAAIRQELIKQGMDPKVLEKITDDELLKMVNETLKENK
jgi:hypothetical protein